MAIVKHVLSFDAGELSPWLDGRTDLAKYPAGCRKLENFIVHPQGGISKRPGMEYCGQLYAGATDGRLVEFALQGSASEILVLGGGKMKVFAAGVPVQSGQEDLAVTIPWSDADLPTLRWKQINDVIFFVHPLHAPQKLTRTSQTSWTLAESVPTTKMAFLDWNTAEDWKVTTVFAITGEAWTGSAHAYVVGDIVTNDGRSWVCNIAHTSNTNALGGNPHGNEPKLGHTERINAGYFIGLTMDVLTWGDAYVDTAATPGQSITLTANKATWVEAHEGTYWKLATKRGIWNYDAVLEVTALAVGGVVKYSKVLVAQDHWTFQTFGLWIGKFYVQKSVDWGATWTNERAYQSSSKHRRNFSSEGQVESRCWIRLAYAEYSPFSTDTPPYAVLQVAESRMTGIVLITDYVSSTEVRATVMTPVELGATEQWAEGAWSDYQGWPNCIELHQNRLIYASTTKSPHTIWGSAVDDYQNFEGTSAEADESFRHTVVIGQREPIVWLASDRRLVIGSGIGEYTLRGEREDSAVTPEFGVASRQSSFGSHVGGAGALLLDSVVLFVQNGGRIVRELAYKYDSDRYEAGNLTLLSDHLFTSPITAMALQRHPFQMVWLVAGGLLYSLTYERGQNICAWQRHVTDGTVLSVACMDNQPDDEVWLIVKRGSVYGVERLSHDAITTPLDTGKWLDSYMTLTTPYSLTNNPLAGKTVAGWCNGVAIGAATLNSAFFTGRTLPVVVGLPYTAAVMPMTPEILLPNGSTRTREQRIHSVVPSLYNSRGGSVGELTTGTLDDLDAGSSSALFTGETENLFEGGHATTGNFCLVSDEPFPFAVRSIAVKLNVYGDG